MSTGFNDMCDFPERNYRVFRPYILILLLSLVFLTTGCNSISSEQLLENPESGISLLKPGNWNSRYFERSGILVLESEKKGGNRDSARIEVHGSACVSTPSWFNGPEAELESNIERLRILYNLDSVTIIQEPIKYIIRDNEIVTATIAIPTISLSEDAVENQVGERSPNVFQIIEIFAISHHEEFIMAYLYKGNSEKVNAEAEKIVGSIRFICSTKS